LFVICSFIALVFLLLTRSRSAFAAVLISVLVFWGLVWPRARKLAVAYWGTVALFVFLLVVGNASFPVLGKALLLGRDDESTSSLNGRVPVWEENLSYVANRPLQGYGYNSFWTPKHELDVSEVVHWTVTAGHNGYLDLTLGVGIVGSTLYVGVLLLAIRRSFSLYRTSRSALVAFGAASLVFYAAVMFMDLIGMDPSIPVFVIFVLLLDLGFRTNHSIPDARLLGRDGSFRNS
jgi:O-antigen ligase